MVELRQAGNINPQEATRSPHVLECREHGPIDIPLDRLLGQDGRLDLNPEIESRDFFAVYLKKGSLKLQARGFVGYIPITRDVVINVRPRAPVSNLFRMTQISGAAPTVLTSLRSYSTTEEWNDSLLGLYADALIRYVAIITGTGLHREYQRREEGSAFPRGRILLASTAKKHNARGIHHRAEIAWFERTRDTSINRCLKYATWLLAEKYRCLSTRKAGDRDRIRRLNAAFVAFGNVTLDHGRTFLSDPIVVGKRPLPAVRAYYRDALNVALAVIGQRSVLIESTGGDIKLQSVVLDMNVVFESYVRQILRGYAEEHNWDASVEDGNKEGGRGLYDGTSTPEATPDIVVRTANGVTPLLLEVKNVPIVGHYTGRGETNQAITYAVAYRAPVVVLVHPRASTIQPGGLHHLGDVNSVSVYQYRFDLGADNLVAEEERFGAEIAEILAPAMRRV